MSGPDLSEARDLAQRLEDALEKLDAGEWVLRADYTAETMRLKREVRARDDTIRELQREYVRMRGQALRAARPLYLTVGDIQYVLATVGPALAEEIEAGIPASVQPRGV